MAKKVTTYEIKGLLNYYLQEEAELAESAEPRVLYCVMKDSDLHLREENTQDVIITVKVQDATVTLPAKSLVQGFYGVCVQCAGSPATHHFLWKSADQRDQKFGVLLRAASSGKWPRSKVGRWVRLRGVIWVPTCLRCVGVGKTRTPIVWSCCVDRDGRPCTRSAHRQARVPCAASLPRSTNTVPSVIVADMWWCCC